MLHLNKEYWIVRIKGGRKAGEILCHRNGAFYFDYLAEIAGFEIMMFESKEIALTAYSTIIENDPYVDRNTFDVEAIKIKLGIDEIE